MRAGVVALCLFVQSGIALGSDGFEKRNENTLAPNTNSKQNVYGTADVADTPQDAAAPNQASAGQVGQQAAQSAESAGAATNGGAFLTGETQTQSEKAGKEGKAGQNEKADKASQASITSTSGAQGQAGKAANADKSGATSNSSSQAPAQKDEVAAPAEANAAGLSQQVSEASTPRVEKPDESGQLSTHSHSDNALKPGALNASSFPNKHPTTKPGQPGPHIEKHPTPTEDPPKDASQPPPPGSIEQGQETSQGGKPPVIPMAMVHSEVQPGVPHTMVQGENVLTQMQAVAEETPAPAPQLDPSTPRHANQAHIPQQYVQGGLLAPRPKNGASSTPLRAPQVATLAAGGETYTASIDAQHHVILGTSTLTAGGPAVTLGNGAAVISVAPGGNLVVGGGTITMSAMQTGATNTVVTVNNHPMTATPQPGANGVVMVLGTATLTSGAPAQTIEGTPVFFGEHGLEVGPQASKASADRGTATAWLTMPRGPGLLKQTGLISKIPMTGLPDPTSTARTGPRIEQKPSAAAVLPAPFMTLVLAGALSGVAMIFLGR